MSPRSPPGPVRRIAVERGGGGHQTRCAMFCARYGVTAPDICPHAEDSDLPAPATGQVLPRDGACHPPLGLSARVVAPGSPRDGMCTWCHTWHGWTRPVDVADVEEVLATPADWMAEVRAREVAALPGSDYDDG
ncbi:MAG: hypothetical protein KGJ23_16030 [Euryarchaeota archaeon]|nr:hypothetical protein [Euryarchaeota archaeon]MDE1838107.1 hypothetical protein [Euryarchaeota archaeon]